MKVCLLFVCCTIVGSHAKGYYGNQGGYRGMTLNVEDDDGKTLTFKTSSSSSEENTRNSREAGPQTSQKGWHTWEKVDVETSQEGGEGRGCHWPCHVKHHHCFCPHEDSEEPTKPTETSQESGEGHQCPHGCHWNGHRCVCTYKDREEPTKPTETSQDSGEGRCWRPRCHWVGGHCVCWKDSASGEPTNSNNTSQEGGEGRGCHWPCHWKHHHCWCPHEDSEEPTNPTEEQSSVQKLVSAGLDLLKAGKKLKFNVDMKNPEALLGAKKTSQEGGEGRGCHWPCHWIHHHCFCPHEDSEEPTKPTETSQDSGEGHWCPPNCIWMDQRCVCAVPDKDNEEPPISPPIPAEEKSSVQKLVSAGLDLLKAGKKLKFNVDVKNPEALLSKDDTSKPKQRFRAYWPKTA